MRRTRRAPCLNPAPPLAVASEHAWQHCGALQGVPLGVVRACAVPRRGPCASGCQVKDVSPLATCRARRLTCSTRAAGVCGAAPEDHLQGGHAEGHQRRGWGGRVPGPGPPADRQLLPDAHRAQGGRQGPGPGPALPSRGYAPGGRRWVLMVDLLVRTRHACHRALASCWPVPAHSLCVPPLVLAGGCTSHLPAHPLPWMCSDLGCRRRLPCGRRRPDARHWPGDGQPRRPRSCRRSRSAPPQPPALANKPARLPSPLHHAPLAASQLQPGRVAGHLASCRHAQRL